MKQVACVCLTRDRDVMLRQAVDSFLAQTYENKMLFILDTGDGAVSRRLEDKYPNHIRRWWCRDWYGVRGDAKTIGELRNLANTYAVTTTSPDVVIAHWDSDDWSHPSRIAEQVGLLESTGADVVGYNHVLFWQTYTSPAAGHMPGVVHQDYSPKAWVYRDSRSTYAIGSSLCYPAKTWIRKAFRRAPVRPNATGEDSLFIEGLNCRGISAMTPCRYPQSDDGFLVVSPIEARMICRIHGGNTADYSNLTRPGAPRGTAFTRAGAFDAVCAEVFSR